MFKTFMIAYRLKDTYRVNTIIYVLKSIPFVKKFLPSSLYKHHGLKVLSHIISGIWEFVSLFIGKIFYFMMMFMLPLSWMNLVDFHPFLQLLLFLTLIGSILNTGMFNPTRDKYYAVILMKMDGRQVVLSQYIYTLIRHIIGFVPCFMFFTISMKYPLWWCFILPISICSFKLIVAFYYLYDYQKNHRLHSENNNGRFTIIFTLICFLLAYALLFFHIRIPLNILRGLFLAVIVLGVICFHYILRYLCYHRFTHDLLKNYHLVLQTDSQDLVNDTYRQMITIDTQITSQKTGFEYFHDLFVKRHKKLLWRAAKRQTYMIVAIVIFVIVVLYIDLDIRMQTRDLLKTFLPYFVFIMYLLNTTKSVTQAMFINCDHSMLTYSFYRIPYNILRLFKIRLREMIKINLLPSFTLATGFFMISLFSGGISQLLNGSIGFLSILAMSVFFSTHYLVLYYLLQPYNMDTEVKSPLYSGILSLTYFICYAFIRIKLPTLIFGIACITFCILYCLISCILVYKKADHTFRIRK